MDRRVLGPIEPKAVRVPIAVHSLEVRSMTHDEFMAIMTKQMYIWRMARANGRAGSNIVMANAEVAINTAVIERATELTVIDPDQKVQFNGKEMPIKDVPDPWIRYMLGYGHHPAAIRQRHRWPNIGEYQPEACLRADEMRGISINDGQNLVCPGCGLDFT